MSEKVMPTFTAPEGAVFECKGVKTLSHPHPYCIDSKHVVWASDHCSGMLTPEAIEEAEKRGGAKCGMMDCQLPYSEHKTETALIVVVPDGTKDLNAVPGLHAWLLSIKPEMEANGITGIAFPSRSQYKKYKK